MRSILPAEEELHAYLDGQLPADRRSAVEVYLRDRPEVAKRLEGYRADGEAIARIFRHAGEGAPAPRRPRVVSEFWRRAAAVVLIVAGAASAGMLWQDHAAETR